MTIKKRFIAGAVCPRCGEMDKIVMFDQADKSVRECIACDFSDEMRYETGVNKPETRLDKTRVAEEADSSREVQEVIRIVGLSGNQ